jgi:hypothetical protein
MFYLLFIGQKSAVPTDSKELLPRIKEGLTNVSNITNLYFSPKGSYTIDTKSEVASKSHTDNFLASREWKQPKHSTFL